LPTDRIDKKSYVSFRLVPKSVTLNDLERRNGPYFALFTEFGSGPYFALFRRIHVRCRRQTIVRLTLVSKSTFDSIMTILVPYAQLVGDYLGKTNSDNSM